MSSPTAARSSAWHGSREMSIFPPGGTHVPLTSVSAFIPRFVLALLLVELLDELAGGVREGAWPFLRQDFGLTYLQIGSLLGVPALLSSVLDPLIGILADTRWRRALVIGGGALFALSLFLTAASGGYALLLLSFILFYPASGAFVNISQAELMDGDPERQDQNMARWTFAGSAGALVGPLALGLLTGTGFGWRGLYLAAGIASVGALALAVQAGVGRPAVAHPHSAEDAPGFLAGLRSALQALRRREVVRWAILMEIANLLLDVLFGFLALYFVEVAAVSPATAALAVTVWTAAEAIGDFLVIPLLERVDGLRWIRVERCRCRGAVSMLPPGPAACGEARPHRRYRGPPRGLVCCSPGAAVRVTARPQRDRGGGEQPRGVPGRADPPCPGGARRGGGYSGRDVGPCGRAACAAGVDPPARHATGHRQRGQVISGNDRRRRTPPRRCCPRRCASSGTSRGGSRGCGLPARYRLHCARASLSGGSWPQGEKSRIAPSRRGLFRQGEGAPSAQARARASSTSRSRAFRVSAAARSNSARASVKRRRRMSRSPRALGNGG